MKKLLFILLVTVISCSEDEQINLSGRYNFIEPPHPISRDNRGDNSEIAFDVIFTIQGTQLTEVDLVMYGQQIQDATGSVSGTTVTFEGGGATINLFGVHKVGPTLQASGADFAVGSENKTYSALQVDPY